MEIVILIGVVVFLLWLFFGNNSSGKAKSEGAKPTYSPRPATTARPAPAPVISELERQRQEAKQLEERKQREEEAARKERQKALDNQESQRQAEQKRLELVRIEEQKKVEEQAKQNARIATLKKDWLNFQTVVQQNNIVKLYHFTDRANISSIKAQGGLLSWHYCKQNNIKIDKPGGSPDSWVLDERKGLQNYVRTSFVRDHPMMFVAKNDGRINNPVVLEINIEVIYLKSTKFSLQNAVKNGITADESFEKFSTIKFPILQKKYFDLSAEDKPYYQAEVLVLEKIPLEYITNIGNF